MMVGIIRLQKNSIIVPTGITPGFDPSHIAAPYTRLSCVASGGNMLDVQAGVKGVITGTPTSGLNGRLGAVTKFSNSTDVITFSGRPTTNWGSVTLAAIFQIDTMVAQNQQIVCTASGAGGWQLGCKNNANLALLIQNVASKVSTLPIALGIPYFAAASVNGTAGIDYLVKRLDTGYVAIDSTTSGTPISPDGSPAIGGDPTNVSRELLGGVAAAMFSSVYMSPAALTKWAENPWDFWYPPNKSIQSYFKAAAAAGAAFSPWWAQNNTGVIGTGAY